MAYAAKGRGPLNLPQKRHDKRAVMVSKADYFFLSKYARHMSWGPLLPSYDWKMRKLQETAHYHFMEEQVILLMVGF